ncbi:hypothetical protein E2320_022296 [Naja naja]|nr:hypothetical protein E2320_022296 [Naja naja]
MGAAWAAWTAWAPPEPWGSAMDRMGSGSTAMGLGLDRMVPGWAPLMDRMPAGWTAGAPPWIDGAGLTGGPHGPRWAGPRWCGCNSMDAWAALSQAWGGPDRIGLPMGSTFERAMDMERNFAAGKTSSGNRRVSRCPLEWPGRLARFSRPKAGCSFEWDPAGLAAPQGLNVWVEKPSCE